AEVPRGESNGSATKVVPAGLPQSAGVAAMSFKMVLLPPDIGEDWPAKIRAAVPGTEIEAFADPRDAAAAIVDADAAYGTVPRELLARARRLRWIAAPRAGLGGEWFYDELVRSPVVVTNLR